MTNGKLAPQEPDDANCGDCGKPYSEHRRALAADVVWCPGDAIRTYVPQEPVADDDALIEDVADAMVSTLILSGAGLCRDDVEHLARAALNAIADRLQAKAPETGEE